MDKKSEYMVAVARLRPDTDLQKIKSLLKDIKRYCAGSRSHYLQEILEIQPNWESFPLPVRALIKETESSIDEDADQELQRAADIFENILLKQKDRSIRWYEVTDIDKKEVKPIEDTKDYFETLAAEELVKRREILPVSVVKSLTTTWRVYAPTIEEPVLIGHNPDEWCLYRAVHEPKEGPMPTWDAYLSRVSDRDAFLAFWWGVWSQEYMGRQIPWNHGKKGYDGKTFTSRILGEELMGPTMVPLDNAHLKAGNKHFLTSYFANAALALYGDCNNQYLYLDELVKMLSQGPHGDKVLVEGKGITAYGKGLNTRMWVLSNFAPVLKRDRHVRSRVLYFQIEEMGDEKPDPKIGDKFREEIPAFLFAAREAYRRVCPDNMEILQNEFSNKLIEDIIEDSSEDQLLIFNSSFEKGSKDDFVHGEELRSAHRRARVKVSYKDFCDWLQKEFGIEKRPGSKTTDGRVRYYGIRRKGSVLSSEPEDESF